MARQSAKIEKKTGKPAKANPVLCVLHNTNSSTPGVVKSITIPGTSHADNLQHIIAKSWLLGLSHIPDEVA